MAQIYKIINSINSKVYIGKTEKSYESRFKQHCNDSSKIRCEKRPLYNAMNKYGIANFSVELICNTNTPEKDEAMYIKKYNSYSQGYNATLGGDGTKYLDIDEVQLVSRYMDKIDTTIKALSKEYCVSIDSIRAILRKNKIEIRRAEEYYEDVKKYSKDGQLIAMFANGTEAAKSVGKTDSSHIRACVRGDRKSAYGFVWKR